MLPVAGRHNPPVQAAPGESICVTTETQHAGFRAAAAAAYRPQDQTNRVTGPTDDAILANHVFDQDGWIVHSTDVLAPQAISAEAFTTREQAAGTPWYQETDEGFLSSIDIPKLGGATAGGILVVYPGSGSATQVRAMGAELSLAALVVLLAVAGLSMLLLRVGLGRQIRTFEAVEDAISDFERISWRSAAKATADTTLSDQPNELRQLLDAAEIRYRATGQALATAQKREQ